MKSLRGRRVLLTGGTGFIGANLARRLCAAGARVHLLVRRESSPARLEGVWEKCARHVGDLERPATVAACVRAARPELVFHLAKEKGGSTFEKEVAATLGLAAALRDEAPELRRWVRTALAVRSRFGRGADGRLAAELAERYRLPVVTLELLLVYGPGQDPAHFPLRLLTEAARGGSPGAFSGQRKDFVHVDDVARAYALAALKPGVEGATIPIGSGVVRPEAEVARSVLALLGRPGACKGEPGSEPDEGHAADLGPARRLLGWEPEIPLEQGLAQMIQWWRELQHDHA